MFKTPQVDTRPCSIDLRLIPAEDAANMPKIPLTDSGKTPEVKLPAPPCGTATAASGKK